jgi:Holliday junction resolvasome RuvABC ATP-dependent DNA helicase subunit
MERSNVSILAATTRPELLEGAFKSRFFLELRLVSYTEDALVELCSYLLPGVSEEAAKVYAGASAGNPRQMEKLCAVAEEVGMESAEIVLDTVKLTADGVTEFQITLMESLYSANRPLGMTALETLLYSDEQSVREAERLLIENDLIQLRSNGRTITRRGKRYLEELNAS